MAEKIAFIKATALTDVCGRIDYASNPERQIGKKELKEKLLAFYQTPVDPNFWSDLAKHSQAQAKYHKGQNVIEAREHVLQISNEIYKIAGTKDHQKIAEKIAKYFKEEHGVEVAVAIHMNDDISDYHAHIIFAERKLQIDNVDRAPATRNTYFDELGCRSTKTKCTDENGKLKRGCSLVKKGEHFPTKAFGPKLTHFADPAWLRSEKERQAEFMTELCQEYGVQEKWIRYNHKTNPHMRLHNLKRGEPAALRAWKEHENEKIRAYNKTIDALLISGEITLEQALDIKRQTYQDIAERREINRKAREIRKFEYERNRERYLRERRREYELFYHANGTKRGLLEKLILLILMIAGRDISGIISHNIDGEDVVIDREELTNRAGAYAREATQMQARIDLVYKSAGLKTPTERMAEAHAKKLAEETKRNQTMQQNNALADLIGEARTEFDEKEAARASDRGERRRTDELNLS